MNCLLQFLATFLWLLLTSVVKAALLSRGRPGHGGRGKLHLAADLDLCACYLYGYYLPSRLRLWVFHLSNVVAVLRTGLWASISMHCVFPYGPDRPPIIYNLVSFHRFYFASLLRIPLKDCTTHVCNYKFGADAGDLDRKFAKWATPYQLTVYLSLS